MAYYLLYIFKIKPKNNFLNVFESYFKFTRFSGTCCIIIICSFCIYKNNYQWKNVSFLTNFASDENFSNKSFFNFLNCLGTQ